MKGQMLCAEVSERGCYLLETRDYLDCKFLVGVEPNQEVITSHMLILAMASRVFESMFYGDLSEKNNVIRITDIQPETFKLLLEYIYNGNAKMKTIDEACNLYYAANKYILRHLLEDCSNYLLRHVNKDNVCRLFEFAQFYENKNLSLKCERIFSTVTKDVLKSRKFEDAELSTVLTIFSYDNLNISSETDLIIAAARYAEVHNTRVTGSDRSSSPESLTDEVKVKTEKVSNDDKQLDPEFKVLDPGDTEENAVIKRIKEKIRFLRLTSEQFAECPERSSILTLEEEHAVIMNLVSKNSNVPMPSDFSTSMLGRNVVRVSFEKGGGESRNMGWFKYEIVDFIYVENVESPPYFVRNMGWRITVVLDETGRRTVSVRCEGESDPKWSCEVKMSIKIYTNDKYPNNNYTLTVGHVFRKECDTFSFINTRSIEWDVYLSEVGSVSIGLEIQVVDV